MKTKKLTLLLILCLVVSCSEGLNHEDINPVTELRGNRTPGVSFNIGTCDLGYKFQAVAPNTIGYRSVVVNYDSTLTAEEVHCARYDFFLTYSDLKMSTLQPSDIHVDTWELTDALMVPAYPNRLGVGGKVEVETAICIDPRTESADCPDPD